MSKILRAPDRALSRVSAILTHIATGLLVIVLALIFIDVLGRNVGSFGLLGTNEIATILMLILISITLPLLQYDRAFLGVDIASHLLRPRSRTVLRLLMTLLQLAFTTILTWRVWLYSLQQINTGRHTDVLQIPQYIPYMVALVAFAVVAVICILQSIQMLASLITGELTDEHGDTTPDEGHLA